MISIHKDLGQARPIFFYGTLDVNSTATNTFIYTRCDTSIPDIARFYHTAITFVLW